MANGKLEDYEFSACRLRRHQWDDPKLFAMADGRQQFVVMRFVCLTCNMERNDVYARSTGDLEDRYYKAPAGYHIKYEPDERRLTTRDFARALIRSTRQTDLKAFKE